MLRKRFLFQVDQGLLTLPRSMLVDREEYADIIDAYFELVSGSARAVRDVLRSGVTDLEINQQVEAMLQFEIDLAKVGKLWSLELVYQASCVIDWVIVGAIDIDEGRRSTQQHPHVQSIHSASTSRMDGQRRSKVQPRSGGSLGIWIQFQKPIASIINITAQYPAQLLIIIPKTRVNKWILWAYRRFFCLFVVAVDRLTGGNMSAIFIHWQMSACPKMSGWSSLNRNIWNNLLAFWNQPNLALSVSICSGFRALENV